MDNPLRIRCLVASLITIAAITTSIIYLEFNWWASFAIVINAATFLTYAYDKHAARKQYRRTPEKTLHLLALLGGSPAALLAQQTLRHKTQKRSFKLIYWVIVVIQITAIGWWIFYY